MEVNLVASVFYFVWSNKLLIISSKETLTAKIQLLNMESAKTHQSEVNTANSEQLKAKIFLSYLFFSKKNIQIITTGTQNILKMPVFKN